MATTQHLLVTVKEDIRLDDSSPIIQAVKDVFPQNTIRYHLVSSMSILQPAQVLFEIQIDADDIYSFLESTANNIRECIGTDDFTQVVNSECEICKGKTIKEQQEMYRKMFG